MINVHRRKTVILIKFLAYKIKVDYSSYKFPIYYESINVIIIITYRLN